MKLIPYTKNKHMTQEQGEDKKSYFGMIVPYLFRFKWRIIISLLLIVAGRVLSVANPYIIKELIDALSESALGDIDVRYL